MKLISNFLIVLISVMIVNDKKIKFYNPNDKKGTFWEINSKYKSNTGFGLQFLSQEYLRLYNFDGNDRSYDVFGDDILIGRLRYDIQGDTQLIIPPYYTYKILDIISDDTLLIERSFESVSYNKNESHITFDTSYLIKSKDQKTLPKSIFEN